MRLFVAIELPEEWLTALKLAQDGLRAALDKLGAPRLRWVKPEGIHLTLKFLGGVPESRLASITEAINRATATLPEMTLVMGRPGSFGDRRSPRVIWAGVDGATVADRERLYRLVESLETWLAAAGFERDRRFSPHLTLARLPENLSREQRALVAEASAGLPRPPAPAMTVRRVSLMRSRLGPGGARYERIAAFPE